MKFIGTGVSLLVVLWAAAKVWGLPPRIAGPATVAQLAAHALFVMFCWLYLQRIPPNSTYYTAMYHGLQLPSLVLALYLAAKWCSVWPLNLAAVFTTLSAAGLLLVIAHDSMMALRIDSIPLKANLLLWTATVYYAVGSAAWLAAVPQQDEVTRMLRVALGGFWLAQGAIHFGYVHGMALNRMGWTTRIQWLPQVAAILIFAWLVWTLRELQPDEGRLALEPVAMEASR